MNLLGKHNNNNVYSLNSSFYMYEAKTDSTKGDTSTHH